MPHEHPLPEKFYDGFDLRVRLALAVIDRKKNIEDDNVLETAEHVLLQALNNHTPRPSDPVPVGTNSPRETP